MRFLILLALLTASCDGVWHDNVQANDGNYRVGAKLPQSKAPPEATNSYQRIGWDALVPAGWNPMATLKGLDLSRMNDADARAMDALDKLKLAWSSAPVEHAWDGRRIRIAGFVVPLERSQELVTEFLLVPYFGACIHVPPPPANQIIHVFPMTPVKDMKTMDAVWVTGVLKTTRSAEDLDRDKRMGLGVAGYSMTDASTAPFQTQ